MRIIFHLEATVNDDAFTTLDALGESLFNLIADDPLDACPVIESVDGFDIERVE